MLWTRCLVLLLCWATTGGEQQQAEERVGGPAEVRADARRQRSPPPVEPLDFGYVPAAVYDTHAYYEPGPIGILFHMVHAFLYVVQPNSFPKGESIILLSFLHIPLVPLRPSSWVYYEAGFLICATIGISLVVLTPIIGMCFCVCRCCENCGGEMHQRQRKNADCQRGFYTATLGILVAYAANHNISTQIKSTRRFINTNMRDLKTFANNTPAQIEYLTAQYTTAKNKVLSDLDNIGPLLGGRIHSQLEKEVVPSLDTALRMAGAMRETKEALENVSSSLEVLQEGTGKLQASLSGERASLSNTLSDPACTNGAVSHTCNTIRSTLSQLGVSANFLRLPDVNHALSNVNTVLTTDLSNIVQKGYSSFNDTPRLVKEQTKNIVSGVKGMLDKIGLEINNFARMFPVEASLANFTLFLSQGQKNIESFYPQIDQFDFYRFVPLCMVVLVLAFNMLGLLCGTCGYDKQATPTTRGCLSNTGGNLLMAGVGFSFICSWLLMAIVTALFVVGGNVEKLMCEPLANRQLFQIIDTPFLVHPAKRNFLPGMLFQNPNIDLTLGSMYRECHENNGLYHALQLETMFNINTFLNRTVYNKDLAKVFENVQVDLQDIALLEKAGRDNLINFANSGVGQIDYEAYLAEVTKGVTLVDLLTFSTDLEAQADQLPRGALENALRGHASSIRQIHREMVVPMDNTCGHLHSHIQPLRKSSGKCLDFRACLEAAVVCHGAGRFGRISQSTTETMYRLIHDMHVSVNTRFKDVPLDTFVFQNTFWFGLGACAIFMIPSIIFSIKLAKYYRRMDTEDVFEEIPRVCVCVYACVWLCCSACIRSSPYGDTLFPRASAPPSYSDW
uniref:Prominin 1 b n=1 Tax=Scophthalmus maximus TaxID=52904 RepID=A0A8D3C8H8_SCOMX